MQDFRKKTVFDNHVVTLLKNQLSPQEFTQLKTLIHNLPYPIIHNVIAEIINNKSVQKKGYRKINF
jgi:hypothetical protein